MLKALTAAALLAVSGISAFAIPNQMATGGGSPIEKAADVQTPPQNPSASKWIGQTIDHFLSDDSATPDASSKR